MTALIIGLLAAVGIGGGVAIANNSGGHGGSHTAIVETNTGSTGEEIPNPAADLNPDYTLISALTADEYNITAATEGSLLYTYKNTAKNAPATGARNISTLAQIRRTSSAPSHLLDGYDPSAIYDLSGEDLTEQGRLTGDDFDTYTGDESTSTLDLRAGRDKIGVTTWKWHKDDENNINGLEEQSFYLTSETPGTHNISEHYKSFEHADEIVTRDNGNTLHHYTAVHLGGSTLGLSTADFGRWEEASWEETPTGEKLNQEISFQTFMFFDDKYAYKGKYTGPNSMDSVPLRGWAIADVARSYNEEVRNNNLYTGSISFNLNLNKNTLTGSVNMPGLPDTYSFDFSGDILGSIIRIDGTAWHNEWPQAGVSRGGMGKLLVGKDGLEIVGNMGPQVYNPTDEYIQQKKNEWVGEEGSLLDEHLRSLFERGSVDYTFGAKEVTE